MAYDLFTGSYDDDQALVAYLMQLFQYARQQRVNFEVQWEESAALVWPDYRNSFSFGHVRAPGVKYTQFQVDSSGAIASHRFMSIADALLTPFNMLWSGIRASDTNLMKSPRVRQWFDAVTQCMWAERYTPNAGFIGQNQQNWQILGAFGNQAMFVDDLDTRPARGPSGLRYMSLSPGEVYRLVNHQGMVDGFIRHFRWTARQAHQRWGEAIPPALKAALEKADSYTMFNFLQFVIPRTDYDPHKLFSVQGKPWCSIYVSVVGYTILEHAGYYEFPMPCGDYPVAPEEWYGRGPAQMVLPELKTLNAEKEAFLKQGLLAADPAYLLPSDDLFDFKAHSGAYISGGMDEEGRPRVGILPTGNIQITKELMEDSKQAVKDAFLLSLFPLLFEQDGKQRSAREVIEVANQMGIFLAPTLGRQFSTYLNQMVVREAGILRRQNKFPPVPPELREARGQFRVMFTGPLAKALSAQPIAGFMRTLETAQAVVNVTGDHAPLDNFDFDVALPEIARDQHVPERWMSNAKKMAAVRKQRTADAERERQVKELPGKAAIIKAQAIMAKAQTGGNIGGTLSGTPEGGMPAMPNTQGMPGQPGVNGAPGQPGQPGPGF